MGKYTRICEVCGKQKRHHTISRRCVRCYNKNRGLVSVQYKLCENCGEKIPKKCHNKLINPARYLRKRFCGKSCASSYNIFEMRARGWESSTSYPKVHKPSREQLYRMFSQLHSYKLIADKLGVSKSLVSKWLGPKEVLLNPKYED